ncbi:MAG TPA: sugar phosphate isomerase/epimerase [Gemmatimonadales bacterium]|nr:sugar phosphate isomerase/epimerase [Gemmatimonadales bacterium]
MITRRTFVAIAGSSAAGLMVGCHRGAQVATQAPQASAGPSKLGRIGVQLFTMPKLVEQGVDAAFAMLAGLGYQEVELFGPFPYSVPAVQEQWRALAPRLGFSGSGYFGLTAAQFRARLDAHGLTAPSMHVDLDTLRDRTAQVAEDAHILGASYAGLPAIPEERRRTLDDYLRMADEMNAIGVRAKALGFKLLYHNHGYGFTPTDDGKIPTRVLFDRLDPSAVALEMDTFWTVAGGADPVELLDSYPRLYRLMHVKDMATQVRFKQGGTMDDWIALMPAITTDGSGVLDLPRILGHAKRNGVEHFYVEQDLAADPPAQLGTSIKNLRAMTLAI